MRRVALALPLLAACATPAKRVESPAEPTPTEAPAATSASVDAPPTNEPVPIAPADAIVRADLDAALAHGPGWLLRQLGPEPYRPRGRFEGWVITAVFPDAPQLCGGACDLRRGDVILSVEGDTLETPDAFVAMLARVPDLTALEVVRLRDGAVERKRFAIVP